MRSYALIAFAAAVPLATPAAAVTSVLVPYSLTTNSYTQNFNTLAATGESNVLPTGFQIAEAGTSATVDGNYTAGTGSDNAGDTYSFGSTGSTDRALGTLLSGSNAPLFGFVFTNNLSSAITALAFNFAGEQWRSVAGASDRLDFQYRLGGGAVDTGSWTDVNALDILSRVNAVTGAVDGNLAANRALYTGTISGLNIGVGQSFAFRFVDFDTSGADTGLALDDLTFTATAGAASAVPEPASWGLMLLGFGSMAYFMRRRSPNVARIRFA